MQSRHTDRNRYFYELAETSRKHLIPYILQAHPVEQGMKVLEIGCGDGGILLPFSKSGCDTLGIDISSGKIENARKLFAENNACGSFIVKDIFMAFPAWQMLFGGHQQICRNKFLSHLPFIHLLPEAIYRFILNLFGEDRRTELLLHLSAFFTQCKFTPFLIFCKYFPLIFRKVFLYRCKVLFTFAT